ncbi:SulP family inorganic anion transporter [Streptomyces olivaceus]|uniref:SulP family inorganic anion transporter n=1 Tax=Streptomyces olivaceus TaxID=47716 RepID=A0ABS7VZR0_STROV|nr:MULTISPECIES: SulP family inorganic anion transporter [Streptomyces]AOW90683.1 sodium-independent anion transporter [Streptomyces olivaceus]MBZ6084573.1 SulP family inorganic anion transporter [Streptomyces olivaceus]MBZ6088349.1 SulP family inorganic anion transporter [Streptomyces olivaceus]MBZ6094815.1 SulP family inorganic anion transporter [Streptomyces olivaceus]MBZ6106457.1 SulP family inorganic anion transporter [Streptomyces olivaceus]
MSAPVFSPSARLRALKPDWISDPKVWRTEVLAGLVVALALVPEAISFSIIAGVDPEIGLFAAFTMAVTISVVGGRRAMISAATGAVALVIAPLNREHGLGYLVAAVILAGVFQVVLGALGVARLMRFVPRSVMVGFVNALAVLIFMAQVPELTDVPWPVYPLVAAGLVLMVLFPRVTRVVPAPLVSIVVLTVVTVAAGIAVPTVGDKGELPHALPVPGLPDVPFTLDTLTTVAPYALAMALVGLMESLMTAKLVDDITDTRSDKTRESIGQGIANIVTGFFGGMGGCAMIGQTMINVKVSGARTRLSTFLAGSFLMVLCVVFGPVVSDIPMAALVAVMVMVSFTTFDWHSVAPKTLRRMPAGEIGVMAVTVAVVVATDNLAVGVVVGSVTAMVIFARRVARLADVTSVTDPDGGQVVYSVTGELFFASSNDLVTRFDYAGDPDRVVIDLSATHVWDASSVAALDAVETKYARRGKEVEIVGLNEPSSRMRERLGGTLAGH